jgi:HAMP domain-containing protein
MADFVLERAVSRLRRLLHTVALYVIQPAMEWAANSAVFNPAVIE